MYPVFTHPSPLPQGGEGEGSRSPCFSKLEFDSGLSGRRISNGHPGQSPFPQRTRGKGADLHASQNPSSTQDFHVGVSPTATPVSPLFPCGRGGREQISMLLKIRVRLRTFTSAYLQHPTRSVPSFPADEWEGSRSPCFSKSEFDSGLSRRRISNIQRGQSPLPLGEG
ncbi:hypothetical protein PS624_05995 [Pseudomonas fluorescens]|uniref:Uncharacterized protein n=1 Tax=Pseudomonas fluorescens TaxID=294 RepID=A0A5E6Y4R2_PSEFL|nr:hypothetical protein PS624_05995 [Pseudomonas fluorescens]